jgi:hypothetical protein
VLLAPGRAGRLPGHAKAGTVQPDRDDRLRHARELDVATRWDLVAQKAALLEAIEWSRT